MDLPQDPGQDFVIEHMVYESGPMGHDDGKLKHTVRHTARVCHLCDFCLRWKKSGSTPGPPLLGVEIEEH